MGQDVYYRNYWTPPLKQADAILGVAIWEQHSSTGRNPKTFANVLSIGDDGGVFCLWGIKNA